MTIDAKNVKKIFKRFKKTWGLGRGLAVPPPGIFFFILDHEMAFFGAF